MQQIDVMFDLETFGTDPRSVILSIGAVVFNSKGLGKEFYVEIDPRQTDRIIQINTISWWFEQSIKPPINGSISLKDAAIDFTVFMLEEAGVANENNLVYMDKKIKLWANGIDFDWGLLKEVFLDYQIIPPFKYNDVRDYRTLKALFSNIPTPPKNAMAHNALEDAKWQATHTVDILNSINYWKD